MGKPRTSYADPGMVNDPTMLAEFKTVEAPTTFTQDPNNGARKTANSTSFATE
ncbi:MAG: hypothetical protein HY659_13645 [Rhizobiales bacterium]|nr:hypothetical protein [Hyphomicrobiales bacterium]